MSKVAFGFAITLLWIVAGCAGDQIAPVDDELVGDLGSRVTAATPVPTTEPVATLAPSLSPTATATPVPTPVVVSSPTPTPTPVPSPTATPAPTSTPTVEPTSTPTPELPATPLFAVQGELPLTVAQVNEIVVFVETQSGRPFITPPQISVQPNDVFVAGFASAAGSTESPQDVLNTARRLQALGFTTQSAQQFAQLYGTAAAQNVGGYFTPDDGVLHMPSGRYTPGQFALVLVHELVHALDSQYVQWPVTFALIERAAETGNYELANVGRHIIEGRASLVQQAWSWPPQWGDPRAGEGPPEAAAPTLTAAVIPDVVWDEILSPYHLGPVFIRSRGGVAQTWDLLTNLPATTEEVLASGAADLAVKSVETPVADGPVLESRYVGAFDLGLILSGRGSFTSVSRGWAGGASVMWGDETTTCVRIALATDTAEDRDRLFATFERWVAALDSRSVVIDGELVVATACASFVP